MKEMGWPTIDSKHLVVNSKQMLDLESEIFSQGMPQEALMEKVGIQISKWLLKRKSLLKEGIIVLLGPGHNGGDGAVIAKELFLKGYLVKLWCPFPLKKTLTINYVKYLTSLGVKKLGEPPNPEGKDLWIDAVFGNNQKRKVDENLIELFNKKFEKKSGKVVSLDVPTGLCPNSGKPFSKNAVKANYNLVIGLNKIGLLQDTALPYVGELHHVDIGISKSQLCKLDSKILKITYQDFRTINLPFLPKNSSKYKRGRTLLIAGSEKYPGAAHLAIKGAISSGAGFVSAIIPELVSKSIWQVEPETVVIGKLSSDPNGNSILFDALKKVDFSAYDSIVIGPGIGLNVDDWEKSTQYLLDLKGLLILDADALNRISKSNLGSKFFLERNSETWITPHNNEFARLFPDLDCINKVELAKKAAKEFDISILLKGANSIIANNENAWQLFGTDAETARAGLGDLLSGFIGGSSAIDLSSFRQDIRTESLAKYVFLHSLAASKCKKGSNASLIGDRLSKLMRKTKTRLMS
ncbi:NAD(P)H-hydrate dehydratase [Prochlorococcus sp. AH-716-N03]|nr:NAD(P)H-hydrate dehydratase [Prochlorococcus sp. AH-716-N03]